jgi:hypothetical protein
MAQQIIHNTGINYTLYYNVLNYFKTIMKNHPSIGVATYGDLQHMDLKEYPMYPIGNVNIINTVFGTNVTTYTIELVVADKGKNKNNQSEGERNEQTIPFFGVDDDVYIHSNTLGILNDLTSYTQRGIAGFDIDGEIDCIPFVDRFDNGLAGWVATFSLTTHNDKNRCLFFLINPSDNGYLIRECLSGDEYTAVISGSADVGQVFSTKIVPGGSTNYNNLVCYNIIEQINGDAWDYVNLPILALPLENYGECTLCELWINPKKWGTTPATWASAPNADFRTWIND